MVPAQLPENTKNISLPHLYVFVSDWLSTHIYNYLLIHSKHTQIYFLPPSLPLFLPFLLFILENVRHIQK